MLGEAANQVSDATRADHINIGWRDPIRVRNRIVHGYATVDVDILVAAAQDDIPALLEQLRSVAQDLTTGDQ